MSIEPEIKVFEDRIVPGQWRVEYFDDDGAAMSRSSPGRPRNSARGITAMRSARLDDTRHRHRKSQLEGALVPPRRFPPLWLQRYAYANALRDFGAFIAVVAVVVLAGLAWLWVFGA